MRLLMIMAITLIMAFSVNASDLAGVWKGTVETEMGATDVTIAIEPGATLTGKLKAGQFQGDIEKAKVDGSKISFEANIEPGKLAFEGTVAGDEMKLTMTGTQGAKYALVCKRHK